MSRKYTVVGYYPDNMQPWVDWVEAADATEAASVAMETRSFQPRVIEVFFGHRKGLLCNEEVLDAYDLGRK